MIVEVDSKREAEAGLVGNIDLNRLQKELVTRYTSLEFHTPILQARATMNKFISTCKGEQGLIVVGDDDETYLRSGHLTPEGVNKWSTVENKDDLADTTLADWEIKCMQNLISGIVDKDQE